MCVLCDNFITDIKPLRQCVNLLKVDLKGNKSHLITSFIQCVQAGELCVNYTKLLMCINITLLLCNYTHTSLKLFTEGKNV